MQAIGARVVSKLQKTIDKQRGSKVAYTATAHTHRYDTHAETDWGRLITILMIVNLSFACSTETVTDYFKRS